MSTQRLRARIDKARVRGRARLSDWRFVCNKRGIDGSAKANIMPKSGATVWGVVFVIPADDLERLDAIEGGYERTAVEVELEGDVVACVTYASTRRNDDKVPFDWYRDHIIAGASEHGLPADYVAFLRTLPQKRSC